MRSVLRLTYLIICLLSVGNLFSQELSFNSSKYDFGTFAEDGGEVSHTFTFKNSGTSPVVIVSAHSSCGCTVPSYSRQPIATGGESMITVTYDPMNRPGKFSKTVEIVVAPSSNKYVLTISGDVTARKKSVEEQYPFDMGGGFRISGNYYPFSHIEQGGRAETQVKYINESSKAITVELKDTERSGVLDVESKFSVAAGATGNFILAYDLNKAGVRYGVLSDRLTVVVNGKESKYPLIVNGHAIDKFTRDDRSAPPICNTSTRTIRVGQVAKGAVSPKGSIEIENTGVRDLVVRNVAVADNIKCSLTEGTIIKPGETKTIEAWAETKGLDYGNFSGYVSITVNDPDQPLQRVRVVGEVVAK